MAMKAMTRCKFIPVGCLMLVILLGMLSLAMGAETNLPPDAAGKVTDAGVGSAHDFLRSYLQVQEQLHEAQSAIEKMRQEALVASASNSVVMEERLRLMEKAIANERFEQLNGIARLDKTILIAAGAFACVGLLVFLLAALLQWAALNRLAAAAANLPATHPPRALVTSDSPLSPVPAVEQANLQLLGIVERLGHRLQEVEASVKPVETQLEGISTNGAAAKSFSKQISPSAEPNKANTITLLLSKSQTLARLDQPQAALDCLDEVLDLDPGNADALVKKGAALERLQRIDEAIECYDRAIAQDASLVVAYLYKAGLFNRMERHTEALACYEQALKPGKIATGDHEAKA